MSFVTAAPEMLATAAQNVANIGTSLSAANATAAASTTSVLAAGADEVSQAIARLFSDYATHYQSLNAQAAAFHHSFVQTLNAAGGAYSSAEAANASAQALEQNLLAVINAPAQALFGRPLIGNGANGTAASPNGGDGGILYGNGGNGFSQTTAGVAWGATRAAVAAVAVQQATVAPVLSRPAVGAIADQRAPQQQLGGPIDHIQHRLHRGGIGGLGRRIRAGRRTQCPHKLLMKCRRLCAQRLIGLGVPGKQRRDGR